MAVTTQYDVQLEILNKLGKFSDDQLQILNSLSNLSAEQIKLLGNLLDQNKDTNLSLDKIIDIISKYKIVEKEVPVEKIVEKIVPVEKIVEKEVPVEKIVKVPTGDAQKQIIALLDKICELEDYIDWRNSVSGDMLFEYNRYCSRKECKCRCH